MTLKFEATTVKPTTRSSTVRPHLVVSGIIAWPRGVASFSFPCQGGGKATWNARFARECPKGLARLYRSNVAFLVSPSHEPVGRWRQEKRVCEPGMRNGAAKPVYAPREHDPSGPDQAPPRNQFPLFKRRRWLRDDAKP